MATDGCPATLQAPRRGKVAAPQLDTGVRLLRSKRSNQERRPAGRWIGLAAAVTTEVIGPSDTAALERHQPRLGSRARLLVRRRRGSRITGAASGGRAPQAEVWAGRSRAGQMARSSVEAEPPEAERWLLVHGDGGEVWSGCGRLLVPTSAVSDGAAAAEPSP